MSLAAILLRRSLAALIALLCLIVAPTFAATYTDNGNGTVTDPGTGLIWMRCSMGQTWTGSTCTGTPSTYDWVQANALASTVSFAGHSDWRLPNIRELRTIVDPLRYNPAIDTAAFPNTPSDYFWSASDNANANNYYYAWGVHFWTGSDTHGLTKEAASSRVRLVRAGQSFASLLNPARPTTDYVDHSNGTVTHTPTGLMWQRCAKGQTWTGSTCSGSATAHTWNAAMAVTDSFAGYADWRLPTIYELESLVDYTKFDPAVNTTIFPASPSWYFWSASADTSDPYTAWYVYFGIGDALPGNKLYAGSEVKVLLVRAGQSSSSTTTTTSSTTTTAATTTTTTSTAAATTTTAAATTTTTSTAAATTTTTASTTSTTLGGFARTSGNMADARYMHTATLLPSGKVLIAGGWNQIKGAELYDPATGKFTATGAMSGTLGRGDHTATLLPNGKVLMAGGSDPNTHQYFSSAELYDPATGTFSSTGNMTTTRSTHTATLLPNGKVLIAGGATADSSPTSTAEIYDPATGTFVATGSMTMNRTSHAALLLKNGKVLIAAGSYYYGYSNTAELYDPATNTFTAISGTMTSSRAWGLSATLLNDGRVLIAGGGNSAYLKSAEIFDPSTNQFTATGSMRDARRVHTGTVLANGTVLIAGGQDTNTTRIAGAEVFDPATGAFAALSSMSTERSGHTATLLPNGQVLIAGGANNTTLLNTAELYGSANSGGSAASVVPMVVAAGDGHACAVTSTSGVKCWGRNSWGELGDGTTTSRKTPGDVAGLTSGIAGIASGLYHACALTTAGGVKCWGNNQYGGVGDNSTTSRSTPVDVAGLTSGVKAITVAWWHTCALTTTGGVKCWGLNSEGQLGDGTTTNRATPVDVSGLTSGVVAIAAEGSHSCAITSAGGVKCWGRNGESQLGDNSYIARSTPVDVSGLASGIAAIELGSYHSCALTTDGGMKCWGANWNGQLGNGTTSSSAIPVDVTGLSSGVVAMALGSDALGSDHSCALTTAGGMKCWGYNVYGQLGDGSNTDRSTAVDVSGLTSGVAAIAAGNNNTCAVTNTPQILCWGRNDYGQLGDNTATDRNAPVVVQGLVPATGGSSVTAISLVTGWNLVGNGSDAPIDVVSTFSDTNSFLTIWKWIAAQAAWAFHAPSLAAQGGTVLSDYVVSKGYQALSSIAGGEGFWVNAKQAGNVNLSSSGKAVTVANLGPTLITGWNLSSIGETATAKQFCDAQSGGVTTLWAWDATNSAWYFYAPSLDTSGSLSSYVTGKGYLDFTTTGKTLGQGVGFWVNRQ